jgi:signal transduction histidine kinase
MGEGSERLRQANGDNFIYISRMFLIGILLYAVRYGLAGGYYFSFICVTASLITLVAIYIFYKRGTNSLSTHLLMICGFWVMGVGSFINGGIDSNGVLWVPAILAFSCFFLSLKDFLFWAVIWLATLVVLTRPEKYGLASMAELTQEQMTNGRIISVFAVTLTLVLFFFSYRLFQERTISEISQQKDELKNLNANLRDAEAALGRKLDENVRLLRVLSHDIATPIQVIMFMLTKLEESDPTVIKISNATKVMEEIVTSVREMQATLSGKAQVRREEVNLRELLDKVIDLFEEKLRAKSLKINFLFDDNNYSVVADRRILANQVVANIISNSIKFSPNGSHIDIGIKRNGEKIQLSIRDYGIGMPASLLAKIFQFDQNTSRKGTGGEKGTGFGMPLMKSYLDLMECPLTVQSWTKEEHADKHGTEFTIEFQSASSLQLSA